jgi:hypothetical protein
MWNNDYFDLCDIKSFTLKKKTKQNMTEINEKWLYNNKSNTEVSLYSMEQLDINDLKLLVEAIYELLQTNVKKSRKAILKIMIEISQEFEKKGLTKEITDMQTKILNKL